jgi:hypothetical protein
VASSTSITGGGHSVVESFRPLQDRLNAIGTFRVGVPEVRLWDPPQNLCNILGIPLRHRAALGAGTLQVA